MDTSNPSHAKGKRTGARDKSDALRREVYLITLSAKDDAKPFGSLRGGETVLNARGKALAACWRELSGVRPVLEPDALVIGPRRIQGLLLFKAKGREPLTLADAVKLFKVLSSLRLAQAAQAVKVVTGPAPTGKPSENGHKPSITGRGPAPSALWKKGFIEKTISGSAELAEARKALKGLQAR
jgi:hypothetical protein